MTLACAGNHLCRGGTRIYVSTAIVEGLRCFFIEPRNGFFATSTPYGRSDDEVRTAARMWPLCLARCYALQSCLITCFTLQFTLRCCLLPLPFPSLLAPGLFVYWLPKFK